MTKPEITIPPEARMAATAAYLESGGCIVTALRAAIAAWPGIKGAWCDDDATWFENHPDDLWQSEAIILPLPQESADEPTPNAPAIDKKPNNFESNVHRWTSARCY